jgi:hypothetical protein
MVLKTVLPAILSTAFLLFQESRGSSPVVSVFTDDINVRQIAFDGTTVIGCSYKGIITLTARDSLTFNRHPFTGYGLTRICGIDSMNKVWFEADPASTSIDYYVSGWNSMLVTWDGARWEKHVLGDSIAYSDARVDRSGRVWIGAGRNFLRVIADGATAQVTPPTDSGFTLLRLNVLGVDASKAWISAALKTSSGTILYQLRSFDGVQWAVYDSSNSTLPNRQASGIILTRDSNACVYYKSESPKLVCMQKNGKWERIGVNFDYPDMISIGKDLSFSGIEADSSIKTILPGGQVRYYLKSSIGNAVSLTIDKEGCLWASTDQYELVKINGQEANRFSLASLKSNFITSVVKFKGNIIAGTRCGLSVLNAHGWTTLGRTVFGTDVITCLLVDSSKVWVGTRNGLYTYDGNAISLVQAAGCPFTPSTPIRSLYRCRDGSFWAGGYRLFGCLSGGAWKGWAQSAGGFSVDTVKAITQDSCGNVWLSVPTGVLKYDGASFTGYGFTNNPVYLYNIAFLGNNPEGKLWAISTNLTKFQWSGTQWDTLAREKDPYVYADPYSSTPFLFKSLPGSILMAGWEGIVIVDSSGRRVYDKYDLGPAYYGYVNDVWVDGGDSVYLATNYGLLLCKLPVGKTPVCRQPIQKSRLTDESALRRVGGRLRNGLFEKDRIDCRVFALNGKLVSGHQPVFFRDYKAGSGTYVFELRFGRANQMHRGSTIEIH